jgi:hypothetical protein
MDVPAPSRALHRAQEVCSQLQIGAGFEKHHQLPRTKSGAENGAQELFSVSFHARYSGRAWPARESQMALVGLFKADYCPCMCKPSC